RPRWRFVRIQHRYPDETPPCRIAVWTSPRLDRALRDRPYARDEGVLTLADCVAHLTGRAARRLRLADRGLVGVGYAADLVLFDPATVRDTATYDEPRRQCAGIPYVYVNGEAVIADGRRTGALPG